MEGITMKKLYKHFSQVDLKSWLWKDFSPREIASKGEGEILVNPEALDKLQALRNKLGRPILLTSAYRSRAHNKRVGGAPSSKHMLAEAFDCRMENQNPAQFEAAARSVGFLGFGYYPKSGFMHIDLGPARSWGTPFPKTDTALPVEPVIVERIELTFMQRLFQALLGMIGKREL
jgi:zinc D-Ala-D-Ala carboxypeptidase